MNRWNTADSTLLCAALFFLAAVGFKILYPENIFAEGLLFVTEAALVGGIADWFAVTALFKKPLGFSFHTAILPRRREEFVNASVKMVQQEFFSRRTIFKKLGDVQLLPRLTDYLEQPKTRKLVVGEIFNAIKNFVASQNKENKSKAMANELRRIIRDVPAKNLIKEFGGKIQKSDKDKKIFIGLIKSLRTTAEKPETREKIREILETYASEKTQSAGALSLLMVGFAQMLDLVNFDEAAEIMQTQLLKLLDELESDSPLQRRALNECRMKLSELTDTPEFRDLVERLQIDAAAALPLESSIELALIHLEQQLATTNLDEVISTSQKSKTPKFNNKNIGILLSGIINSEYGRLINFLKTDGAIKDSVEKFIYDLTARTALHAQPLAGTVARAALGKLTEEQLNSLVYDKAEKDFVWIRLNGSIVGSFVGLVIFILIKAVQ